MAATVDVQEGNGSPVTWTTITTARFCTTDSYNPGTSHPCVIPTSGFNYSYWKHHCLNLSGTFTQISNIRFRCDGSIDWTLGTDGELRVGTRDSGDNGCPEANYQQASGTEGTTGHPIEDTTNGHSYYNGQSSPTSNIENYTAGSELIVDSTEYTSASRTKSVVLQVKIASDATQGEQPDESLVFLYDEI